MSVTLHMFIKISYWLFLAQEKKTLSIDFKPTLKSWYFQSSPILTVSSPGAWRWDRGGGKLWGRELRVKIVNHSDLTFAVSGWFQYQH